MLNMTMTSITNKIKREQITRSSLMTASSITIPVKMRNATIFSDRYHWVNHDPELSLDKPSIQAIYTDIIYFRLDTFYISNNFDTEGTWHKSNYLI